MNVTSLSRIHKAACWLALFLSDHAVHFGLIAIGDDRQNRLQATSLPAKLDLI